MASATHFDIWLDRNPEARIKNLIDYLTATKVTLEETTCEEIVNKLCDQGYDVASEVAAFMPSNNNETSRVEKSVNGSVGTLSLVGSGAVYDEFGTGEEGADNPHPMKNDFPFLNPYNSGPFVSTHINPLNNRHFWIYPPMSGKPYFDLFDIPGYTEGIPAGMPMYQALQHIRKIKNDIIIKEINDSIKVLK